MSTTNSHLSEIYTGQLYTIAGELFELTEFRVTDITSPNDFTIIASFKNKDNRSSKPYFEERVSEIIGNADFTP